MVGNSGRLKGSGHGLQIDAHDWVLRWVTRKGLSPPCLLSVPQLPCEIHQPRPCDGGGGGPCSLETPTLGHALALCCPCPLFAAGKGDLVSLPSGTSSLGLAEHAPSFWDVSSCYPPRMNRAKIAGFELDVGMRTTHHFMYPESAVDLRPGVHLVLVPFKPLDLQWVASAFSTGELTQCVSFRG